MPRNPIAAGATANAAAEQRGEASHYRAVQQSGRSDFAKRSRCGSVICRTKVYSGTSRSIVANRGTTMADAVATHAETRALTDADLTAVSGGLFTEIGGAIVERIADA